MCYECFLSVSRGQGRKPTPPPAVYEPAKETPSKPPDAAMEAEIKAARERAQVPLDIRISRFKEMLAEKEVRD